MYLLCYFLVLSCVSIFSATNEAQLADNKKSCLSDKFQGLLEERVHEYELLVQGRADNYLTPFNLEDTASELERIKALMPPNTQLGTKVNRERYVFDSDFFLPKEKEMFLIASIVKGRLWFCLDKETREKIKDCMKADFYPVDIKVGGDTLLHLAVDTNNLEITEILLTSGVDVQAKNEFRQTPLAIAACEKNDACMETLIAHGASVKVLNEEDKRYVQSHIEAQVKRYLG